MRIALLFSCLFILSQTAALAQFPSHIQERFQSEFDDFVAVHNLVGVSVAVRSANHSWTGVSGYSTATDPIDSDHVFAMGSISKTITAATIFTCTKKACSTLTMR